MLWKEQTLKTFSSYLQSWIGQKIDQCFWLENSFFPSPHIFYYVLTLSCRWSLQCIPSYILCKSHLPILACFAVLWNPNWMLSTCLPSVQKHGLNSLLITSLIFLNIFNSVCIVVLFTNEINKNSYMKITKATIPTELDLNKHEFLAIFLRWHFNKNKLFLYTGSQLYTQKN